MLPAAHATAFSESDNQERQKYALSARNARRCVYSDDRAKQDSHDLHSRGKIDSKNFGSLGKVTSMADLDQQDLQGPSPGEVKSGMPLSAF